MSQEVRDRHFGLDSAFGFGIASLGPMSLVGDKSRLGSVNLSTSKSKKQRIQRGDQRMHRTTLTQKVFDGKRPDKTTWQRCKGGSLDRSISTKDLPDIKVEYVRDVFLRGNSLTSTDEDLDADSDSESEDFVYQCPGLSASAEDMTVENPLFNEKLFENSYRTPELPKKYWKDVFTQSI